VVNTSSLLPVEGSSSIVEPVATGCPASVETKPLIEVERTGTAWAVNGPTSVIAAAAIMLTNP